ncbi:GPI transamidase component PIG-S [Callorhinchus milii]|uniref:Phosphatidylinositol glycan anchor biosynthesis, class S n=1 Tax=Callorhinchus milii TaxID=7868 RepID=K4FV06_CALMI|nr:GPI transamidase component PIG-S [Callorhinchus milii]AFK11514.1 phosphatidylinositol glycan anchor biosynthesis, class S [Callorhinchus milii]
MAPTPPTEQLRGQYAAGCISVLVLVFGIPLWWRTTETYRATLPYSRISTLDLLLLDMSVPVQVVFTKGTLTPEQHRKLLPQTLFSQREKQLTHKTGFKYRFEEMLRAVTVTEQEAIDSQTVEEAGAALERLSPGVPGSVTVYVIPKDSQLLPAEATVHVGKHRAAFLRSPLTRSHLPEEALRDVGSAVRQVLGTMSFTEDSVMAALSDRVPPGTFSSETLTDSMRALKSSLGYEITFSLLNPDPRSHHICWDIERGLRDYVQPFLDKLAFVANFSVSSQVLYYVVLGVTPRYDKASSSFTLTEDSLPHVINPVEAKLGSSVTSSYPVLNFLLYVPEYSHSPLYIRDSRGEPVETNAFHSSRWGGIMVYNVGEKPQNETVLPVTADVDMERVMEVFLAQLRLLLGLQTLLPPPGFTLESPGNSALTDWELDRLLWMRTVENIATATNTLTSLAQLLDEIGNIVINDHIAAQVYRAVDCVEESLRELEAGRLAPAFQASKEAVMSSETAFFDPSLLHLLYFPDDQKFAIYIPLFLPMGVPILLSLLKISKKLKQRDKKE